MSARLAAAIPHTLSALLLLPSLPLRRCRCAGCCAGCCCLLAQLLPCPGHGFQQVLLREAVAVELAQQLLTVAVAHPQVAADQLAAGGKAAALQGT